MMRIHLLLAVGGGLNQTLVCHETAAISGKTIEELYGGHVHMIQHQH